MDDILEALRKFDALRDGESGGDIVRRQTLPAIPPTYADNPIIDGLSSRMRKALIRNEINCLYQHQADAIAKSLEGSNVVLQAPTASGKTLAFQIPMLEALG